MRASDRDSSSLRDPATITDGRGRGDRVSSGWRCGMARGIRWGVMDERGRRTDARLPAVGDGSSSCSRPGRGQAAAWGPKAVRYTRMRYNEVVRDTNDQQLLMNIVRLRYADSPVFIDLPNITSQFELAAGGSDPGRQRQPDQLRHRGHVGARHADPELPPARGAGDRQGAVDPALGRPVQRGQRRRQHRAAPAADRQRHQRRAQRRPGHDPHPQGPRRQRGVPPGHPDPRLAPGSRRHRAGDRDERGVRGDLRPDPRGARSGAATCSTPPGTAMSSAPGAKAR